MDQAIRKLSGLMVLPVLLAALLMMPLRASAAEYACDAVIPVSMELNGDHDEQFEVTIEAAEGAADGQPMPAEEERSILLADGETGGFAIHYTEPGDYYYVIRQTAGSTAYMSYDATVYEVQVQVTNDTAADGSWTLKYQVVANDVNTPSEKAAALAYLNTYAPPPATTPTPDEHPDIAEGIENGTWGGKATATPDPAAGLVPQTGDTLPLTALVAVLVLAAAAIVVLVAARRRSHKDDAP